MMIYLFVILVFLVTSSVSEPSDRSSRQFFTRLETQESSEYKFCKFRDRSLPCLTTSVCESEGGSFISYCGSSGAVCCNLVVKKCSQRISSHAFVFQNSKYPQNETQQRTCSLTQTIRRGICAVRVNFESFETTKPRKDYCPGDAALILGTKSKVPWMCGNLTGYSTTFEVEEGADIEYSFTLQGFPAYRFSLEVISLPCQSVTELVSSPQAGIRNKTAVRYEIPVKEPAAPVTTEMPIEATTIIDEIPVTESDNSANPNKESAKKEKVSDIKPVEEDETDRESDEEPEDDIAVINNSMNRVPPNSFFQEEFDRRAGLSSCQNNMIDVFPNAGRADPLISGEFEDSRCWAYDPETSSYAYTNDCPIEEVKQEFDEPTFRIIDGNYANINEYPWQVAILYNRSFVCGGSLISDRYVLTAAHCVYGGFKKGMEHLIVSLGDHDLKTKNDTNSVYRHVKRILMNLHYYPITIVNDISILELSEPVDFKYSISPVKLPTDTTNNYDDAEVTVTGWGRYTTQSRKTSAVLKEFTSTVYNVTQCEIKWQKVKSLSVFPDMHICLNITTGTPCHGDSGGPLVACNNDHCTVVGLVSFAFPLCRDVGLPAIFSRVTSFKRWIDINTTPIFYETII